MKGYAGIAGTIVTVFIVAALAKWADISGTVFGLGGDTVKAIVDAGVFAVAAAVIAALNPKDTRYGIGSGE
jgi:hypothetical protein